MEFKKLEDWCKWLEKNFSLDIMIPTLPVIIRLDGNNFKNWTKTLNKPFDEGMSNLMIETTKFLVKETNAVIGYTQSDEITLILYSADKKSAIYNDGKKQKILSKLSGDIANFFNENRKIHLPNHNKIAKFDCRIYQTPTLFDATLQLLWRENDGTRNSISMLARSLYSHDTVEYLNSNELQNKMLTENNVNWNDLAVKFKRGTYIKRVKTSKPFSAEEIEKLPKQHQARKNPELVIERNIIEPIDMPIFNKITNKVDVVFNDIEPIIGNNEINE